MFNPIKSIIRRSIGLNKRLNILTAPTHERYETGLCLTDHNFYAYRAEGIKDWNTKYGNIPENYILLDQRKEQHQVLRHVDFDLVLSQNRFGQFQALAPIAQQLNIPLIALEHTLPHISWNEQMIEQVKTMRGDVNVFISNYSVKKWGWVNKNDTYVVHHMVDTDVFKPSNQTRQPYILSVVNDWINRDWCCNFKGWQRITDGLQVKVLGDTPGLSETAKSIDELVRAYQQSAIFLNTSTISPVPTALLEAMACGCACVTTATCMIPEIIEHGVNGFISNDENELRKYCQQLLSDKDMAIELGNNAVKTINANFNKETFIENWNNVFYTTTHRKI